MIATTLYYSSADIGGVTVFFHEFMLYTYFCMLNS